MSLDDHNAALSAINFITGLVFSAEKDLNEVGESDFEDNIARHVLESPTIEPDGHEPGNDHDGASSREAEDLLPPLTFELARLLDYESDYDRRDLEELQSEMYDIESDLSDIDDEEESLSRIGSEEDEETLYQPASAIVELAASAVESDRHRHRHGGHEKETIAEAWSHIKHHENDQPQPSLLADSQPVRRGSSAGGSSTGHARIKANNRFGSAGSMPQSQLARMTSGESYIPPRLLSLTTPPAHLELDAQGRLPAAFRAAYHEEEVTRAVAATVLMCPLFGVLQLLFLINDHLYFSSQPFYTRLLMIRIATATLFMLVALRAYLLQLHIVKSPRSRTDDPWISNARIILTWATFGLAALNTDLIILSMPNPGTSPYWVGFTLILLSLFMTRPFSFKPLVEFSLLIVFQHMFLTWWFDPQGSKNPAFLSRSIFLSSMVAVGALGSAQLETLRRREFLSRKDLRRQKDWSALLLHSVLPAPIAKELEATGKVLPQDLDDAVIMFTDFVGFTGISAATSARHLVKALDRLFAVFDIIISRHRLEKLKTIGDAYMCAAGLVDVEKQPNTGFLHLVDAILAALEMIGWLESGGFRPTLPLSGLPPRDNVWQIRIGIHRGPVTSGVIGRSRFAYDCWGSTVNIASRLEGSSVPGKINVATEVFNQVEHLFEGSERGSVPVKNLPVGQMLQHFIDRIRPEYSLDEDGRIPNAKFWEVAKEGPRMAFNSSLSSRTLWKKSLVVPSPP